LLHALVEDQREAAYFGLATGGGTGALPVRRCYDIEGVIEDFQLHGAVGVGAGRERGRGVYFDEPGFEVVLDKDIEPIYLKTVLIVDYSALYGLEGHIDYFLDLLKTLIRQFLSPRLLQIELQIGNAPLASMMFIIIISTLLNRHIRQMNHHVIQLCDIICVLFSAKTGEPP